MSAGRDITAIASQIEAKRDVTMSATENLNLVSAANEQHSASKAKKVIIGLQPRKDVLLVM
ncbi:hemagglutinin repeat-containing protein [Pseudomonas sp. MPFS]|nr:hemagglutinin repeat-containing protein [Pseudomonas sp. MPFS]